VPIAFFETAWLASLGRQVFFEEATLGRVTSAIDGCASYLMPLVFALFMVVVLAAAALIRFAPVLGTPAPKSGYDALSRSRRGAWLGALLVAALVGSTVGIAFWSDWQINRPCM